MKKAIALLLLLMLILCSCSQKEEPNVSPEPEPEQEQEQDAGDYGEVISRAWWEISEFPPWPGINFDNETPFIYDENTTLVPEDYESWMDLKTLYNCRFYDEMGYQTYTRTKEGIIYTVYSLTEDRLAYFFFNEVLLSDVYLTSYYIYPSDAIDEEFYEKLYEFDYPEVIMGAA